MTVSYTHLVPGKTLSELLKLIKDSEEPVEISAGRRHILFKIENYTVCLLYTSRCV